MHSGIQSPEGGFYSWFDLPSRSYPYLYSEITGYGITALLFLETFFKNDALVAKAEKAAEWLAKEALHPCGGVLTRIYNDESAVDGSSPYFKRENIFFFDTGMALFGVASLYKRTANEDYLSLSRRLADFMLNKMLKEDGSAAPIYNTDSGRCIEDGDKWSNQPGAFHAKAAMGLFLLSEITGEKKYHDAALGLCEYALANQDASGRFITDKSSKTTHLHPHSYAAEGLWYAGTQCGVEKFREGSLKAAEWAIGKVTATGVNELYDPQTDRFNDFQRCDILAQVLRLGMIFSLKDKMGILRERLLSYQYEGGEQRQRGGFIYFKGEPHLNSWCSMFALQALALSDDRSFLADKGVFLLV